MAASATRQGTYAPLAICPTLGSTSGATLDLLLDISIRTGVRSQATRKASMTATTLLLMFDSDSTGYHGRD